jgi:hypothetical protein
MVVTDTFWPPNGLSTETGQRQSILSCKACRALTPKFSCNVTLGCWVGCRPGLASYRIDDCALVEDKLVNHVIVAFSVGAVLEDQWLRNQP